jgi:hypothetical protein
VRLLPLALLLAASCAQAGWVPVVRDADTKSTAVSTYMDPKSLSRKGDYVSVRVLINFSERSEEGIASAIGIDEFDCMNDRLRSRSSAGYAEPFGKGRLIREFQSVGAWTRIIEGTVTEALFENACDFYPQWWSE